MSRGAQGKDDKTGAKSMKRLPTAWISLGFAALLAAFNPGQAHAQAQGLASAGPTDPGNGFPQFYQDKTGTALEPCLANLAAGDPCAIAGSVPGPTAPVVFPTNFPSEWFYWTGNARIRPLVGSNSFRADLTLALEGTFGGPTGAVASGDQIVFARFRFRVNGGLVPNATYTVTHPFGVKTFVASTTGTINFTEDQGCGVTPPACNFASVLPTTNVGPFLKWDATAPSPPAGYVGDANVTHSVTGSPFNTNFLRIDGPNVGGPGINTIQTNQFTVTGKIYNGVLAAPLTIDRTSYARAATGTEIDLFAHSVGAATIVGSATGLTTTTLTKDATSGRFYARIAGAAVPPFIRYTVTAPGSDPTVRDAPVVDEVTITQARYSLATHTLTVNATSSEQVSPPVLTATGSPLEPLGTLSSGVLNVVVTAPPYQVVVTSSKGGTAALLVDLVP
jgi:hypothetical protein